MYYYVYIQITDAECTPKQTNCENNHSTGVDHFTILSLGKQHILLIHVIFIYIYTYNHMIYI